MTTYDNNAQLGYDDPAMQSNTGIIDKLYLKSASGIVKAVEMTLDIIVFICASVWGDFVKHYGGGWVQFVSMSALVLTIIVYVLYVFQIQPKLAKAMSLKAPWDLCEMAFNGVYDLFYLIAGIVSACFGHEDASIAAAAFFCFAALLAYGIDTFLCFRAWRNIIPSQPAMPSGGGATATTTQSGAPQY